MLHRYFFHSLFLLGSVSATVVPTPTLADLELRQEPVVTGAVPTFTFGARNQHIPLSVTNPEPSGDKLQIYPIGIYDDYPQEGIHVAFGPDLRAKIKDTMAQNCKDKSKDDCRNALIPVIHNTDVGTHAKRFVLVSTILLGYLVAAVAAEVLVMFGEGIYLANSEVPKEIKFEYGDMNQIHDIGNSNTIAFQEGPAADPTTVTIPTAPTQATETVSEITIETVTADSGDRKAGDIVYHLPVDAARRIQDFLGMLGIQDVQKACEGVNFNDPSNSRVRVKRVPEACGQPVRRLVPRVINNAPEGLFGVANRDIPLNPGPGQEVGFPVPNYAVNNVPVAYNAYHFGRARVMRGRPAAAPAPPQIQEVQMRLIVHTSVALAIVTSVVMLGQMALEIVVPKTSLMEDLKADDFLCPSDILCIAEDCKAQEEEKKIHPRNAFCKVGKHEGCKCKRVRYSHETQVKKGYMDAQYEWLQELIKLADTPQPSFESKCDGELQEIDVSADQFKDKIKKLCTNHAKLQDGLSINGPNGEKYWTEADSEAGFTWSLTWENTKDTCPFDCETVFLPFADDKNCLQENGVMKNGVIETECGKALYNAYKTGGS